MALLFHNLRYFLFISNHFLDAVLADVYIVTYEVGVLSAAETDEPCFTDVLAVFTANVTYKLMRPLNVLGMRGLNVLS
jgi:hypothetical protein